MTGGAGDTPPASSSPTSSFGFEFDTEDTVFGLRAPAGRRRMRVSGGRVDPGGESVEVGHWPAIPGKRAEVSIAAIGSTYRVTVGTMARFLVDPHESGTVSQFAPGLPPILQTTTLMSSPMALSLVHAGSLALHAAAVDIGGRAVLLAAAGTGGKTTLAAGFHIAGHRVLSDDLVGVRPDRSVEPSPALLRLRYDSAEALGNTLTDVAPRLDDAGKRFFEIAQHRRADGAAIPCAAVVFLTWDSDLSIEEIPAAQALQRLWPLSFYLRRSPASAEETFERLAGFVDSVPSYVVRRPRDFAKLQGTVDTLESVIQSL